MPELEKPIRLGGHIKLKEKVTLKDRPKIKLHSEPHSLSIAQAEPQEKIAIKVKRTSLK